MRILTTKKIWRAFPELDQFDDKTCFRFVKHYAKLHESKAGWLWMILVAVATFTIWIFIESTARTLLYMIMRAVGIRLGPYSDTFLILFLYFGRLWFPWLSLLLFRDRWLSLSIRKELKGERCKKCEYSLLGLEAVIDQQTWKYVLCPECGTKNEYQVGVLVPADIASTVLIESKSGI